MAVRVGDKVKWTSQAQGSFMEKEGTVLAILPAGEDATRFLPAGAKKSHIKFQPKSAIYRALVEVMSGAKHDIPNYYAPRMNILEEANGTAEEAAEKKQAFETFDEVDAYLAELSDEELIRLCTEIYDWKYNTGVLEPDSLLRSLRDKTGVVDEAYIADTVTEIATDRFRKLATLLFKENPGEFLKDCR